MSRLTLLCVVVCVFAACEARLDAASMRKALNFSPVFSHQREKAILEPQNVNVVLPVSETNNAPQMSPPSPQGRPIMQESQVMGGPGGVVRVQNRQEGGAIPARKPVRQQQVLARRAPRPSIDRPIMRTAASQPDTPETASTQRKCSFEIPSFLLPDPNADQVGSNLRCPSFLLPGPSVSPDLVNLMVDHWTGLSTSSKTGGKSLNNVRSQVSQVEFEQKCLIPALRAHVVGGPECRSRELTVYLEWLLYLRQKLFNI